MWTSLNFRLVISLLWWYTFSKAMLKLTHSFCRFLKLSCHSRTHVKTFTHLSSTWKVCCVNIAQATPSVSFPHTCHQVRLLANIKKKFRGKKQSSNFNETKKFKPMSDSLQPSLNHVSFGGQFDVSANEEVNDAQNWLKQKSTDGSSGHGSKEPVTVPSDFRVWEPIGRPDNDGNSVKFTVVSYNVLAQCLLEFHPYLYTNCEPRNLIWKVRAERLYDEITNLAPDILCLQEVQASHLKSFYSKFEDIGYHGVYKQKTGQRHDGCAIYFKKSLFSLKDQFNVEFYQPQIPLLNRDNIGIMVKLMPKNYNGPPLVVATTHLLYNPKRTDVRVAQIQVFLAEIDRFAYYNNGKESGHLPIILTGDFNSTPNSAVINLLNSGCIRTDCFNGDSDWARIGVTDKCQHLAVLLARQQGKPADFRMTKIQNSEYQTPRDDSDCNSEEQVQAHCSLFNSGVLRHSLKLSSVYKNYKPNAHFEATTFQDFWVTVDYIYFSCCSSLRLVERLRLPTVAECHILRTLPNDVYGSDHLALAAVFELKQANPLYNIP